MALVKYPAAELRGILAYFYKERDEFQKDDRELVSNQPPVFMINKPEAWVDPPADLFSAFLLSLPLW